MIKVRLSVIIFSLFLLPCAFAEEKLPAVSQKPVSPPAQAQPQAPLFQRYKVYADPAKTLGSSNSIRDFFGSGGALYYITGNFDDPVVQAWRNLDFKQITFEAMHVEEPMDRWIQVTVDEKGEVQIDFSEYDRYIRSYIENLNARPFVYLGNIPRALSSKPNDPDYAVYMPKTLKLWQSFVKKIVQHNIQKFKLKGLNYGVLGEPDHPDSWKGSGSSDPKIVLNEHIELYAATYRAVKAADPSAKFGGPATMSWKATEFTPAARFVLKDWIQALAQYNQKAGPGKAIKPDFISWQDYGWAGPDISDGAEAVSGYLKEYGFDPAIPKMLAGSGWGSWASNYLDKDQPSYERASHVVHSLIGEFGNPQTRKFFQAIYYSFYFNDYWMTPETEADLQAQRSVSLVIIPKDRPFQLTPIYAAFQMAHEILGGEVAEASAEKPLEAMSVWNDVTKKFYLLFTNLSAKTVIADVAVDHFPIAEPVQTKMKSIDEFHSVDGYGLEGGFDIDLVKTGVHSEVSVLVKPHGTILLTFGKPEPKPEPSAQVPGKEEKKADDGSVPPAQIHFNE